MPPIMPRSLSKKRNFPHASVSTTQSDGRGLRQAQQAQASSQARSGITFAPGQSFTGVFGGGSAILRLGRVSAVARAQVRSDPWFASRKAWLAIQSQW